MKILVTGAQGMLGTDLVKVLSTKHEMLPFSHGQLDITDRDATISALKSLRPDIIINCAAYTKVDSAEEERDRAFLINGVGAQNVATSCEEKGIPVCHVSTDYVFDGTKQTPYTPFDNTGPINTYGESKLAGEKYIQWITNRFYIVRTSWLYGKKGHNFVNTVLRLSRERDEIKIVHDQTGSPTWTVSLSAAIGRLIETGAFGIYHVTDDTGGGISWYDFAQEIIASIGSDVKVEPVRTEDYPTAARRPRNSVLDMSLNAHIFGFRPPKWSDALRDFLSSG